MISQETYDKLMQLAVAIAMLGSGATISRDMSALAHEITGVGTGR